MPYSHNSLIFIWRDKLWGFIPELLQDCNFIRKVIVMLFLTLSGKRFFLPIKHKSYKKALRQWAARATIENAPIIAPCAVHFVLYGG